MGFAVVPCVKIGAHSKASAICDDCRCLHQRKVYLKIFENTVHSNDREISAKNITTTLYDDNRVCK
jgi:hypothetical protein